MQGILERTNDRFENLLKAKKQRIKINTLDWKEFKIGDLFKKIIKPPVLHSKEVEEDENGIPYVVRTKFNNGIKCRVKKTETMNPSPAGVISFGAENATFFYQEEEFVSGRDIYYIKIQYLSKNAALFLTACLQPIAQKYSYNYGMFPDLVKEDYIKLPVASDGTPDWDYMDSYMGNLLYHASNSLKALTIISD
ncbi:MAG: restriction endonuclease subunit S [Clostridia bacterium]|nr:restriction endonuclease subunit S [Clostridia bacterium]